MYHLPLITSRKDLRGVKVLLRTAFNVPVTGGVIDNDFRIRKALPTINWLREAGAKIIIVSHIWGDETTSLKIVHDYLSRMMDIGFSPSCDCNEAGKYIEGMKEGDVVLLENVRLHDGEVGNQERFAEELSSLAEVYVNDAFSVSHRSHASVVGIPRFLPSYIGIQFKEELDHLSLSFNPPRPFVFILGGAKFSTKMPLIRKFIEKADTVYVGGALMKPFLSYEGIRVDSEHVPPHVEPIDDIVDNPKIVIPSEVICFDGKQKHVLESRECSVDKGVIVDVAGTSLDDLREIVRESAFVLWNGPLGDYEKGFFEGTIGLAHILIESGVPAVVGGGDTIGVLSKAGLDYEHGFAFTSTAGGAMLQFLAEETLVGIEAIHKSNVLERE